MKKLLFSLIAIVMFGNFSFGQETENFIKAEMYGTYHNQLLEVYTKKYKDVKTTNFIDLYDNLKKEFEILHPNVLTNEEYLFYRNRLISIFGKEGNLNSSNYHELTMKAIKMYYSPKTQKILINLLESPRAPEEVSVILQNLLEDKELPSSEINEIKKLQSVYLASVKFWPISTNNLDNNKYKCNPKHQQYLADAFGCVWGGLGAIAYSWLIEEMQNQHGGGCI